MKYQDEKEVKNEMPLRTAGWEKESHEQRASQEQVTKIRKCSMYLNWHQQEKITSNMAKIFNAL